MREAELYVEFVQSELERFALDLSNRKAGYFKEFKTNLIEGIDFYSELAGEFGVGPEFKERLGELRRETEQIAVPTLV